MQTASEPTPRPTRRSGDLVAYVLSDRGDDDHGARIVFAPTARAARQCGLEDVPYVHVAARRAPEFDAWAHRPGEVPVTALLAAGWHRECGGCSYSVDQCDLDDATGASATDTAAWCSPECRARDEGWTAGRAFAAAEVALAEAEAKRRWPRATTCYALWNRPAWGEAHPVDGWRVYVRLHWRRRREDAYATWWYGDADHTPLERHARKGGA